jgi:hypothetical protein
VIRSEWPSISCWPRRVSAGERDCVSAPSASLGTLTVPASPPRAAHQRDGSLVLLSGEIGTGKMYLECLSHNCSPSPRCPSPAGAILTTGLVGRAAWPPHCLICQLPWRERLQSEQPGSRWFRAVDRYTVPEHVTPDLVNDGLDHSSPPTRSDSIPVPWNSSGFCPSIQDMTNIPRGCR